MAPFEQPRAPFSDPAVTADGAARACVDFTGLQTLWLNTGTLCNIECAHCYIKSSPTNDALSYLTLDDALPHLDDALAMGAKEIGFTGGEPFLNPETPLLIEAALVRGFSVLVLTNAMRPMMRPAVKAALSRLKVEFGARLQLRVSLDHFTRSGHDAERGAGAFDKALEGLAWLADENFAVSVAGRRMMIDADEAAARAGYAALFAQHDLAIATDPAHLVLFPEMDEAATTPEITDACWKITGARPEAMMCADARMLVKRKGAAAPAVLACTLITETDEFELGRTLKDAARAVPLNHPHCSRFCVLGGASCSGVQNANDG